jgi:hypothetical protein
MDYYFYFCYTITQTLCVIKRSTLSKYGRIPDSTIRYYDLILPDGNRPDSDNFDHDVTVVCLPPFGNLWIYGWHTVYPLLERLARPW